MVRLSVASDDTMFRSPRRCTRRIIRRSSEGSSEHFSREHQFQLCSPDYLTSVEIMLEYFYSFKVEFSRAEDFVPTGLSDSPPDNASEYWIL
uniref:Uncharacterized protein n=1 Tax=Arundo donax TaxID=35708 RepID=A0A0A9EAH2_ARUDO